MKASAYQFARCQAREAIRSTFVEIDNQKRALLGESRDLAAWGLKAGLLTIRPQEPKPAPTRPKLRQTRARRAIMEIASTGQPFTLPMVKGDVPFFTLIQRAGRMVQEGTLCLLRKGNRSAGPSVFQLSTARTEEAA